jgi:hypothetical protein
VAGTLEIHQLPGGTFTVEDRVFQYREYVMAGSSHHVSDPSLNGYLVADWNWDVQASGVELGFDGTWIVDGVIHPVEMAG